MSDTSGPQSVVWALFSLKGRIRRSTYGLGIALIFSVWWVAVSQLLAAREDSPQMVLWALILGLVVLVSGYCIYALSHKRLQDIGYRGFYALLFVVVAPVMTGFLLIPLLILGVIKGEEKTNDYGPPPVS